MADYDMFHSFMPVLGTAAAVNMDGTHYTPGIDTLNWKGVQFIAVISANALYSAVTWTIQESDDNSTYGAPVDAEYGNSAWASGAALVLFDLPAAPGSTNSQVFHCSYVGKKRYVKATFNAGGAQTGQITCMLGHPMSAPIWQAAAEVVPGTVQ